jgi:hypothetical protein
MKKPTKKQKHQAEVLAQITGQRFQDLSAQAGICESLSKKLVTRKDCKQLAKDIAESCKSAQLLEKQTATMHQMMERYEDLAELYEDEIDALANLVPDDDVQAQNRRLSVTRLSNRLDELESTLRYSYREHILGQYEYVRNRASELISRISIFKNFIMSERERARNLGHEQDVKRYDLLAEGVDVMMALPSPIITECRIAHDQIKKSHDPWFERMESNSIARHKQLKQHSS